MSNKVFIASSIDGYIADKNGNIDWLHDIPSEEGVDMGYGEMMDSIDALVMGRKTFETVLGFGIPWPYEKPVYVLSNSLQEVPENLKDSVFIVSGELKNVLSQIHSKGHSNLYIDGGQTIQSFLKEDLIDEMIITIIPVLLGGGTHLFGELDTLQKFKCVNTELFLDQIVQNHFIKR